MFSRVGSSFYRTAAWRLALRSTLVFAAGSAAVFFVMYILVARTVRERSDSWLMGESETLKQVALNTPRDALYDRIVEEVAELASQEVSYDGNGGHLAGNTVFFAQIGDVSHPPVWVGPTDSGKFLNAIASMKISQGAPVSLRIAGWPTPFRVVAVDMRPGEGRIYLGLLDSTAAHLLRQLLAWFFLGWVIMVAFGFLITLLGLRRMLKRVDAISGTAASIRPDDLSTRVPAGQQQDEVARLARTLNNMLDRISASVNQLRTLTDSVAHDLKSPITSVRGSLEIALSLEDREQSSDLVAGAIEHLDRLSEVITTSLDLAEADGGALRLRRETVDLSELVNRVAELYAPAFADRHQHLAVKTEPSVQVAADLSLCTRMLSNLMENELRYAGARAAVSVTVAAEEETACITVEDNGPGFSTELLPRVFQRFVKGAQSEGHGLGLAFVSAVAVVHGGRAVARNVPQGGAQITVELPQTAKTGSQPRQTADSLLSSE
ncbi:MAG TPA: ATP-binding protein [Acidobacteriaceae bacterium]|jgi:signal transduction histidine kinase|nr:ATP-binding protein [Acidobacteriaceae bacterium]